MSFLLMVLQISMVYSSGWFEVMSWSWTKISINMDEQSDRFSYLLLDLICQVVPTYSSMAYGLVHSSYFPNLYALVQSSYFQPLEKTCLLP